MFYHHSKVTTRTRVTWNTSLPSAEGSNTCWTTLHKQAKSLSVYMQLQHTHTRTHTSLSVKSRTDLLVLCEDVFVFCYCIWSWFGVVLNQQEIVRGLNCQHGQLNLIKALPHWVIVLLTVNYGINKTKLELKWLKNAHIAASNRFSPLHVPHRPHWHNIHAWSLV